MARITPAALSDEEFGRLVEERRTAQDGACYLCAEPIAERPGRETVSLCFVVPPAAGGAQSAANLAACHSLCLREAPAGDLRLARPLTRFQRLQRSLSDQPGRPNLADVLALVCEGRYELPFAVRKRAVAYSFPDLGRPARLSTPLLRDPLSGMNSFFASLPFAYLAHDERINPRAISISVLKRMIEEFQAGLPQLQVALGWLSTAAGGRARVHVFDGQHKLAAQALLGAMEAPLRVFVDPDFDALLAANTHAGTRLRQVAFDRPAQRRLGNQVLDTRVRRYLADFGLPANFRAFSERHLAAHFSARRSEVRRETLDAVCDAIVRDPRNRLTPFIDLSGAGSAPISYRTLDQTFFALCIDRGPAPLAPGAGDGEQPRRLEAEHTVRLMNLVADLIFVGRFEPALGARRLEARLAAGENLPTAHIAAVRLARVGPLHALVSAALAGGRTHSDAEPPADFRRLFQRRLPAAAWAAIAATIERVAALALWSERGETGMAWGEARPGDGWSDVIAGRGEGA